MTTAIENEKKSLFNNEMLNNFANLLLENNFKLLIPEKPSTYFIFSLDNNLGYCQLGHFKYGICFSTIHRPCKEYGTGFSLNDYYLGVENPTIEDAKKTFKSIGYSDKIVKYKSLDDYLTNPLNQILKYRIVNK